MRKLNRQIPRFVERNGTLYLQNSSQKLKRSRVGIAVSLAVLTFGLSVAHLGSVNSAPPRFLPNGTIIAKINPLTGYGKLAIENGTDRDAVVKLVDPKIKRAVASFYIRANNQAELSGISDGSYQIFFTQGTDWDATTARFTKAASYLKFDKMVDFVTKKVEQDGFPLLETPIWEITLHPVPGGNTTSQAMSESEFCKY